MGCAAGNTPEGSVSEFSYLNGINRLKLMSNRTPFAEVSVLSRPYTQYVGTL